MCRRTAEIPYLCSALTSVLPQGSQSGLLSPPHPRPGERGPATPALTASSTSGLSEASSQSQPKDAGTHFPCLVPQLHCTDLLIQLQPGSRFLWILRSRWKGRGSPASFRACKEHSKCPVQRALTGPPALCGMLTARGQPEHREKNPHPQPCTSNTGEVQATSRFPISGGF